LRNRALLLPLIARARRMSCPIHSEIPLSRLTRARIDLNPIAPHVSCLRTLLQALPAEEIARHARSIAAALFTGLTANVPIHVIPIAT